MRRRVIRKFTLNYIAGVDRPAQEPARAVIMKRAPAAPDTGDNFMSIDTGALATFLLEGRAKSIKKADPKLTNEQAFAAAFSDPDYREVVRIERKAAAARLAETPVARTAAHVLNSLDDDAINALTVDIKRANPYLDDAGIVRLLIQRVEGADYRGDLEGARRAGSHAPGAGESLTAKRDGALDTLNAKAAEYRKADPSLTEAQAFAAAYGAPENRDLAKAERSASRAALS
jgi:hypothetical protein